MNISQPVASYIGSVEFGFLSSEEVRSLSVKRLQNPTTFDSLLHPTPGGLYDTALGAWGDNACSTCHLLTFACPGHPGHIELPVPVYNVTFMDHMLRLLRSACAYCGRLKLHRPEINRFACKLKLIRHGLLQESDELENIHIRSKSSKSLAINGSAAITDEENDESEDEDEHSLIQRRIAFVKRALKKIDDKIPQAWVEAQKMEAVAQQRRAVIDEFLRSATATKTCGSCKGVSPYYRKDKYNKIFRIPLGARDRAKMAQGGFKATNPVIESHNERKAMQRQRQRRQDREIDEGIVPDMEETISISEGEDIQMHDLHEEETSDEPSNDQEALPTEKSISNSDEENVYVNAHEIHASLSKLFDEEKEILDLVYNSRISKDATGVSADMFFIKDVLVPPNKFRPETRTGANEIAESAQNSFYKQILTQCENLYQITRDLSGTVDETPDRQSVFGKLRILSVRLQDAVNSLIDSTKAPAQGSFGRAPEDGVKQKLEKKEGLFRMNMMGKRVNFAARSVISPDPNIETNEIGVPPVFAKKLTYPEPVTSHNFYELKEAVLNGVDRWPGAAAVENENGQVINLRTKNYEERQALANQLLAPSNSNVTGTRNKKVHRHLNNGDIVLMNRQPTLHKPSMMAHRARVLPGEKTLRLHYANCNSYNADFDGDEMNMHFPQNEVARAEALQIADTDHQYLVPTSGKPLRGLIQDHISMGVWLTNRDTFFDREDYYQLLCGCLRPENNHTSSGRIETVIPAVVKPKSMWTGKQVVTSVLKNLTPETHPGLSLHGKSQAGADRWGKGSEEDKVIFRDGELLCGILDKAHLGPSVGGFVHAIYEAYGHTIAGKLLSVLGRLLTKMLHMRAFSCGMEDIVLTQQGNKRRKEKLREVESIGLQVAAKYVTLDSVPDASDEELRSRLQEVLRDEEKQAGLDLVYNSRTATLSSEITSECLLPGLWKPFPQNQMQLMTTSGAKGSLVNANFISCNLGQQVLEGRRVPVMISGKTLPSFKPFETNVRAGGYITDRFLTGVKPQEYFFHAMAGREGLIDTAVKTARSGYLQRCLIKGMEGVKVEYDSSVRDSDGTMVQFLYGEDGLDVTKQKHLRDFRFLAENHLSLIAQLNIREEFSKIPDNGATAYHKSALKKVKKSGNICAMDPVLALFNPGSNLGSTSESFASAVKAYCENNPDNLLKDKKKALNTDLSGKAFRALLDMKYMKSVVDPGEAVGIIAGQSVGEPSTQMTLNTFHLAGHSARNVTLGIPRLREIVMTASKQMSTPTMTLHLNPELRELERENFAKGITKLTLADVTEEASVSECIEQRADQHRVKVYNVKLDLFPSEEYKKAYAIEVIDVLRSIEFRFIPQLIKGITKELKHFGDKEGQSSAGMPKIGESAGRIQDGPLRAEKTRGGADEDEDDEDEDDEDEDATNSKQKQNRGEAVSYAAPDEEEEVIAREGQRDSTPDADVVDEGYSGSPRGNQENNTESDDENAKDDRENTRAALVLAKESAQRIKAKHVEITRFSFNDQEGGSWCKIRLEYDVSAPKLLMLNLVEAACRSAIIQAIPGLGACTYTVEKERCPTTGAEISTPVIVTSGVNLRAMHDHQGAINPHRLFTNDIHAMLQLYGVEAARATIIREMESVFKGHSIAVDLRHLNLIADVMTRGGGFTAFNRTGLKGATSPFMKMSFETTVGFLRDAVLDGDWDDLKGPSARIVVGRVGGWGTNAFDVFMPVGLTE